ncbi:MAG: hypothetical protein WB566_05860 [Terriglobales bacterium]
MDRQIENVSAGSGTTKNETKNETKSDTKNGGKQPSRSDHLMCGTPLWGAVGFLSCGYFAWLSLIRVTHSEYEWPHDLWTASTYIIWILLLAAMALDTRCLRERLFLDCCCSILWSVAR